MPTPLPPPRGPHLQAAGTGTRAEGLLALVALAGALGAAARLLFFLLAPWIWSLQAPLILTRVSPWIRYWVQERDGQEPLALLVLTLLVGLGTLGGMALLARMPLPWRRVATVLCLGATLSLLAEVPLRPPLPAPAPTGATLLVVALSLLFALLLVALARLPGRLALFAPLFAAPAVFVAAQLPSLGDYAYIMAPATLLARGEPLRTVYLQYDLLPSLLALPFLHQSPPLAFQRVVQLCIFAMLAGSYLLARSLFKARSFAPLLLALLVLSRVYALLHDPAMMPQATALRLDHFLPLLACAWLFGIADFRTGLVAALELVLLRSLGLLTASAYVGALLIWMVLRRRPLREMAAPLALVLAGLAASRLLYGGLVTEAALQYRALGIGMLRVGESSLWWWMPPLLACTAALALRAAPAGALGRKREHAGTGLLLVALAVAQAIYFFGRSHEHNLLHVSGSLLFCLFLALDLALLQLPPAEKGARRVLLAVPWCLLALGAAAWTERIEGRIRGQWAVVQGALAGPSDRPLSIDCAAIAAATGGERRLVFFAFSDYWFYRSCGYDLPGPVQPLAARVLRADLLAFLSARLDEGYLVVEPERGDPDFAFAELLPALGADLERRAKDGYVVWRRPARAGALLRH